MNQRKLYSLKHDLCYTVIYSTTNNLKYHSCYQKRGVEIDADLRQNYVKTKLYVSYNLLLYANIIFKQVLFFVQD